ncbi:MAG: hypothetical protein Q8Q41_00840 [bacterium]|nr:hypothetical protein [bacterium]
MRILFVPEALADVMAAILLCPVEISGLGRIERLDNTEFLVREIVIFEQECSSASTEFDSEAKGRWDNAMILAGRGALINEHHLWWHSHVCGSAYFSATDTDNIERFDIGNWQAFDPRFNPPKWWVSLVGNKFGEMSARADFFDPRDTVERVEITTTIPLTRHEFRGLIQDRMPFVLQEMAAKVKMDLRIFSPKKPKKVRNP